MMNLAKKHQGRTQKIMSSPVKSKERKSSVYFLEGEHANKAQKRITCFLLDPEKESLWMLQEAIITH